MSRTYVATCGTSVVYSAPNLKRLSPLDDEPATRLLDDFKAWIANVGEVVRLDDAGSWDQIPAPQLLDDLKIARPQERGSAEIDSLYDSPPAPAPQAGEPLVLLASDTVAGIASALLIAHLTGRTPHGHAGPPSHVGPPGPDQRGGTAHVVRIPGLDPTRHEDFESAIAAVAQTLHWVSKTAADEVVVHVTGGFKATIPYVTALAEYVPAKRNDLTVSAWCRHETASHGQPVFLRQPDVLAAEEELQAVDLKHRPRSTTLAGVGWRSDEDGRVHLTTIGRGLMKMLGVRTATPHDH